MKQNKQKVVDPTIKKSYQKPELQVIKLSNAPALLSGSKKPSLPTIPIEDL